MSLIPSRWSPTTGRGTTSRPGSSTRTTMDSASCLPGILPRTSAWEGIKRSLRGEFEDSVWAHLSGDAQHPVSGGGTRPDRGEGHRRSGQRVAGRPVPPGSLNVIYGSAGIEEPHGDHVTKLYKQEVLKGLRWGTFLTYFSMSLKTSTSARTERAILFLTGISMRRPFQVFGRLDSYKYDCIENGTNIECFHCQKDRWEVQK